MVEINNFYKKKQTKNNNKGYQTNRFSLNNKKKQMKKIITKDIKLVYFNRQKNKCCKQ